jgi:hypothetical protein
VRRGGRAAWRSRGQVYCLGRRTWRPPPPGRRPPPREAVIT